MLKKITSNKFMQLDVEVNAIIVLSSIGDSNNNTNVDCNNDDEEVGDSVDWTIIGIDPGAGIMGSTEDAMEEYDLEDDWDLQESSESAMIADLEEKYDKEEPIIVTGWKPHWIFADM